MADLLSLLFAGGAITTGVLVQRARKRRRIALVRAVAEQRRGVYGTGGWFGDPFAELVHADGVELRITLSESRHSVHTEYLARIPPPGLPEVTVSPVGVVSGIARALGSASVETGIEALDDGFAFKGADDAVVRRWAQHAALRRLLLADPSARLECDEDSLRLRRPRLDTFGDAEKAIDDILDLVRSDPFGLEVLGTLPEAALHHDERFLWFELPGPSPIGIGPRHRDRLRVRTCAWTEALGAMPDDAETLVTPCGGTLETADGELRIWWDGIETDVRRLAAAIEALRRLTSGPAHGVFR